MKYLIILMVLFLAYQIVRRKDYERFKYIFLGFIFIPGVTPIPSSGLDAHRFFIACYLISLASHRELRKMKHAPVHWISIALLVACFMTGYMDDRISMFSKFWKPLSRYLLEFGLLYIGYCTFMAMRDTAKLQRFLVKVALVVGGYGLLTLVTRIDVYSMLFSSVIDDSFCDFSPELSGRMRICSFLMNSHIFGSFCCSMGLYLSYLMEKGKVDRLAKITFALMLIGLLISGSRSALMGFAIGAVLLVVLGSNSKKLVKRVSLIALTSLFVLQVPVVKEKVDSITSLFDENAEQIGGSTIDGRENQLEVSMMIFSQSPIWGNGFDYWGEVVMGDEYWKEQGIYGAESYIFILLIERGLVQIAVISIFFAACLLLFWKRRRQVKFENAFAFSLLASFLAISVMTGNTGKWPLFFPLMGLFMNVGNVECFKRISYER